MFWRIGLALHEVTAKSFIRYTEPGKIRVYMTCGLVVMTTRVREIATEREERGAGFVMDYSAEHLASTIAKLACNESLFIPQTVGRHFASEYSWANIFDKTFSAMLVGHRITVRGN